MDSFLDAETKKEDPAKLYAVENAGDDTCQFCGRNMTEEGCDCR